MGDRKKFSDEDFGACTGNRWQQSHNNSRAYNSSNHTRLAQRDATYMSYERTRVGRKCRKCGEKFKQLATFVEEKGGITIKVYQYKCPLCDALIRKPTPEEVREALISKQMQKK